MIAEHWQAAVVLLTLLVVFVSFVREKFPADVVAMTAVAFLLASGILSTNDALGVFSNNAPITIGCLFVLTTALERTGTIQMMGRSVGRLANISPLLSFCILMIGVTGMSAFINNTPVVVVLTPVVIALAKSVNIPASKFLMPLSFAAIFGGTTTMIGTSTNILVDGVSQKLGLAPFHMFEITIFGLIMAGAGILYMATIGWRLLPVRETVTSLLSSQKQTKFFTEVLVPHGSHLIGKTLAQAHLTNKTDVRVLDVIRSDESLRRELANIRLKAGDRLVIRTPVREVMNLRKKGQVQFIDDPEDLEPVADKQTITVEGAIGPNSGFIGRKIRSLELRRRFGVYVLAVHRHGENLAENFEDIDLRFGDNLLVEGPSTGLKRLMDEQNIVNISEPQEQPYRRDKAPIAIGAVLLVIILSAFDVMPIVTVSLIAAPMVILFGCLNSEDAYKSIEWRIIILILAMLAIGAAMEKTGAASIVVDAILDIFPWHNPIATLAMIYILTSILTEMISNNAVAVLMTPIAVGIAHQLGLDPRPFVVAVMFAASASFATPIGYQTNTFVYGAGGYKFMDFVKVGLPLNCLNSIVAVFVIPMIWPLTLP